MGVGGGGGGVAEVRLHMQMQPEWKWVSFWGGRRARLLEEKLVPSVQTQAAHCHNTDDQI